MGTVTFHLPAQLRGRDGLGPPNFGSASGDPSLLVVTESMQHRYGQRAPGFRNQ